MLLETTWGGGSVVKIMALSGGTLHIRAGIIFITRNMEGFGRLLILHKPRYDIGN